MLRLTAFDAAGQIASMAQQTAGGTLLQLQTFTYDPDGNRTAIVDSNGSATTYYYDGWDRLTGDSVTGTNAHSYGYSYDPRGNRLTSTETGNLATTSYNAAQQLVTTVENTVGTTTNSYDLNGNTTSVVLPPGSAPVTMSYDKENRLTVHRSGSSVATYAYDGIGLKRVEYVDGVRTTLVWDGTDYLQGRS